MAWHLPIPSADATHDGSASGSPRKMSHIELRGIRTAIFSLRVCSNFRDNDQQKERRANAKLGQVFKFNSFDRLTVKISSVLGVQVAKSDSVLGHSQSAMQVRHRGVVELNVRTATGTSDAGSRLADFNHQAT